MNSAPRSDWDRAELALALLAVDPFGLGGICVRARSGPARDALLDRLNPLPAPQVRFNPSVTDDQLFGGIDIAATLASDALVHRAGLLADAASLILPMAERIRPDLAARLAIAMDAGHHCLIALDEGVDDEGLPGTMSDRLAFHVDLDATALATLTPAVLSATEIAAAQAGRDAVILQDSQLTQLVRCADQLGIDSLRAAQFAARTARAHAALHARDKVDDTDLQIAVELALAHRATRFPEPVEQEQDAPEPEQSEADQDQSQGTAIPDEILLEAVRALLPPGLLDRLNTPKTRQGQGAGSGARRKGNRRGRPLPARPGRPDGRARIDLIATLRAAAPWQTLRARHARHPRAVHIHPSDIHLKRFEQKSDRLLIFAVDASGSAALSRLAEAKGAVELLLAQAYARRDHVALIAFRGPGAEVLLPPTRSLVQTKRRLAALPGGGGTPLAAGLQSAMALAITSRTKGMTPTLVVLTDGRANIALDGSPNRAMAAEDARNVAAALFKQGCDAMVIDMGNRPEPDLASLSATLGGTYLPLPRADAQRLSTAVATALER